MSPSQSAAAPRPGEDNGAGATNLDAQNDTTPGPVRLGNRPMPGDDLTCFTLAALKRPEGRARMRELAIGVEAFEFCEERTIAAALLAERELAYEEAALLALDDGRHLPWGMAIGWTMSPERAVRTVERFATARAVWWLPRWLAWISEGLCAGRPLSWAVRELDALLACLRPLIAAEVTP